MDYKNKYLKYKEKYLEYKNKTKKKTKKKSSFSFADFKKSSKNIFGFDKGEIEEIKQIVEKLKIEENEIDEDEDDYDQYNNYPHGIYNKPNEMERNKFDNYINNKINETKNKKIKAEGKKDQKLIKETSDKLDKLNYLVKKLYMCKTNQNSTKYDVKECGLNDAQVDEKYNREETEKRWKEKIERNKTPEQKALDYLTQTPYRRR